MDELVRVPKPVLQGMLMYIQNTAGPSRQWSDPLVADLQRLLQPNAPQVEQPEE